MVGSRSTPVLRTNKHHHHHNYYSTTTNKSKTQRSNKQRHPSTPSSTGSSVFVPDPMKLHKMLMDDDESSAHDVDTSFVVAHTKEELMFYLEKIQSGEKPEPVKLPVARWPNGIPPSTVSSSIGVGSIASTPWSQLSATSRNVLPIRPIRPNTKDYLYDGAGSTNDYSGRPESDGSFSSTRQTPLPPPPPQQNHKPYNTNDHQHTHHKNLEKNQTLMPPEQSPFAERINKNNALDKQLLARLREQGEFISQHLVKKQLVLNRNGCMSKKKLKAELKSLLCTATNTRATNSNGTVASMEQPTPLTLKDIDQLLSSLSKEELDVNGNVHVRKLLSKNNKSFSLKNQARYGGDILLKKIVPYGEKANPQASLDRNNRSTFTRVIVPDVHSDMYGSPEDTYQKKSILKKHLGLDDDLKVKKVNHLHFVSQRNLKREMQTSARCEMERYEREQKLQNMLTSKRNVKKRYHSFLEKESLRRAKTGNRFATWKVENLCVPKRRGNSHQYIQEIGGLYRDKIVNEYNLKRANMDQRLWNKVFR